MGTENVERLCIVFDVSMRDLSVFKPFFICTHKGNSAKSERVCFPLNRAKEPVLQLLMYNIFFIRVTNLEHIFVVLF